MIANLSTRLTMLRQKRHLTQAQVGNAINVTSSLISAYELGGRSPSLEVLIRLSSFFNVSTDYLLGCQAKSLLNIDNLSPKEQDAILTIIESLKNTGNHSYD